MLPREDKMMISIIGVNYVLTCLRVLKCFGVTIGLGISISCLTYGYGLAGNRTLVDDDPVNCAYWVDPKNIGHTPPGVMDHEDRYYHFNGKATTRCTPDIANNPERLEYHIAGQWKTSTKRAIEFITIGAKEFILDHSCTDDPWLAVGYCHSPIVSGDIPPAIPISIAGFAPKVMSTVLIEGNPQGRPVTSSFIPDGWRERYFAMLAVISPPRIIVIPPPNPVPEDATSWNVIVNVKADFPYNISPNDLLMQCRYKFKIGKAGKVILFNRNRDNWVIGDQKAYGHSAQGAIYETLQFPISDDIKKGALVVEARMLLVTPGQSPGTTPSNWSKLAYAKFTKGQKKWPVPD
jgi:hypothetical protein